MIALEPVIENEPAENGITIASPFVIVIAGPWLNVISPSPSRTSATANPAGKSPVLGAK
jgi:hypothetical protein